ncbi:2,5-didehydrogluconate reductase DkgB [Salinicola endophyticus]|uniref:2,5-didehydrogluconate reductase DkgB n=1 Tax=Salinicola endophyticus TaxID=1949083 RepID=A0ABY8FLR8_9GAMM|nr:2,5-didehydrogluconate reductase DkgB [Salinicola endophyticus]WFF42578.1 2,5-didehydrogluconate reductase DkgB [Salinicola endophyticus]
MSRHLLPQPGLGTYRLKEQAVIDSVTSALDLGYRHLDSAQMYGNEAAVGKAVRQSGIAREELFITTKIWWDQLEPAALTASLEQSLDAFGLEQVDLALIHWPSPNDEVPMADYLGALDACRQRGLTRHIGVSNFTIAQIDQALALPGGEHLVTNQIEVHPFLANRALVEHCQAKGLEVTAYMPLAVGRVMEDAVLKRIAEHHAVTPAQIALAWVAARDIIVIPSSTKPEHQKANLEALEIRLSDAEIAEIDGLDRGERIADPDFAPTWDQ